METTTDDLTLPADRVVRDGDRLIVAVPPYEAQSATDLWGPTELVALNRPCDTCNGDGIGDDRPYVGAEAHCPDCDGSGRHVFTITWPCSDCDAWNERCRDCPQARVFTDPDIGVVPVVERPSPSRQPIGTSGRSVFEHGGDLWWTSMQPDTASPFFSPAPDGVSPGDWVAVITEIDP